MNMGKYYKNIIKKKKIVKSQEICTYFDLLGTHNCTFFYTNAMQTSFSHHRQCTVVEFEDVGGNVLGLLRYFCKFL